MKLFSLCASLSVLVRAKNTNRHLRIIVELTMECTSVTLYNLDHPINVTVVHSNCKRVVSLICDSTIYHPLMLRVYAGKSI